jgi:hypothetical protein
MQMPVDSVKCDRVSKKSYSSLIKLSLTDGTGTNGSLLTKDRLEREFPGLLIPNIWPLFEAGPFEAWCFVRVGVPSRQRRRWTASGGRGRQEYMKADRYWQWDGDGHACGPAGRWAGGPAGRRAGGRAGRQASWRAGRQASWRAGRQMSGRPGRQVSGQRWQEHCKLVAGTNTACSCVSTDAWNKKLELSKMRNIFLGGRGDFFAFFPYYIQHCFICRPQIPLCRRMLGSNPGPLQLVHWQSDTHPKLTETFFKWGRNVTIWQKMYQGCSLRSRKSRDLRLFDKRQKAVVANRSKDPMVARL